MKIVHKDVKLQGDVSLVKVKEIPEGLNKITTKEKILQDSETHGKYHRFKPEAKVEIFETPGMADTNAVTLDQGKYVLVYEDSVLYHGTGFSPEPDEKTYTDHGGITVPPGAYKVVIQNVYDYESNTVRKVID